MPLEPEPDLHWTAFLYLTGDLSADEASRFELRLADDQAARDAVLDAVELTEAVALVGQEFPPRRRSIGRRTWIGSAALAAAACLVLAVGPWFRSIRPADTDADADTSRVALAWSSLRSGGDAEWLTSSTGAPLSGPSEAGPVAEIDSESETEVEPSTDRALPSWLLSAASAPLDDAPREED